MCDVSRTHENRNPSYPDSLQGTYLDSISISWQVEGRIEVNIVNFVLLPKRELVDCEYSSVVECVPDTFTLGSVPSTENKQAITTTII